MKKIIYTVVLLLFSSTIFASHILIPMDKSQKNHLKAYGIAYWILQNNIEVNWLLNYRGGSFSLSYYKDIKDECTIRGVSFEVISDAEANIIFAKIASPEVNMDKVKLEKVPRIAVYAPKSHQQWDDAVTMVLNYAEIPYDQIYDEEIINGDLAKYDWLHLHHEDFTGQYGKFYGSYRHAGWYINDKREAESEAARLGFNKVSELKLFVSKPSKISFLMAGIFLQCALQQTHTT